MKMEDKDFVDLLLRGDLEAVTQGLEDGLYSWEMLDQPHNAQGSTPLISACQMGLNMVMHFLLERGADATLCNHSNQTALHVSHSDLQKELLAALLRPLTHRAQLFEVTWRGDIHALQRLLFEADSVDVNIQNQNGLTPLMLAVRDVDLFEAFKETMGWDYDPTKAVKTLLAQSAKMDIQDHKSCTVLTYVSQIKCAMKDELLQIILEHQIHSLPVHVVPEFHFPVEGCNNSQSLSSPYMSTLAKVRDINEPYTYIAVQEENKNFHQDKIIALCFRSAMEPKTNSKATGWTTLPSLRERNKSWTKFDILYPNSDVPTRTSLVPIPPRLTEKSKAITEAPPIPHFSHLSQSAPSLALLDASFLLQVRTNIHNRLCTSYVARERDPFPVPCQRTPKHLAPLDQEHRDGHVFSNFQCPLAPKLTSLPFSCKETRQRLSSLSSRGSRSTGMGSEESSYSSQSSLDEEEVEEDSPQETGQMFGTIQGEPHIALLPPSSSQQLMNSGITEYIHSNKPVAMKSRFTRHQQPEAQMMQNSVMEFSKLVRPFARTLDTHEKSEALNDCERNKKIYSEDIPKPNKSVELIGSLSNEPKHTITDSRHAPADGQSSSSVDAEQQHVSYVNIASHPAPAGTSKDSKITRAKEIKCRSSNTNQTSNILDQINTRRDHGKPKRNRRNQSSQGIVKGMCLMGNVIIEETNNKLDWPKMAPIKHAPKLKDAPLNRRRTPDPLHQGRQSGAKKILNKLHSQKQLLNWDTKKTARQAKRPGVLGTQRTKSSLDYVSYRDMFQEIHQADEGPAIFEMFATPIYENLRAGSSADRSKQVQTAPQFKRQLSGRQTAEKPVEGNRRKKKCITSTGKQRKRKELQPPEPQSQDQAIDSTQNNASRILGTEEPDKVQITKHKLLTTEEDERHGSDARSQTKCSPVLSMIREVPSDTDIKMAFHNKQGDLSSSFESHRPPYHSMKFLQQKTGDHNNNKGDAISNVVEESVAVQLPKQPLINTWTTDRSKSPVYQSFLDEVVEGPVTDDLLKRLAEELISLEEREVDSPKPENPEITNDAPSKFNDIFSEATPLGNPFHTERSSVDDTITWTKGEILGRGAYGTVYCGLTGQGQLIAVKQVTLDVSNSDTAVKEYDRLEREVELLKNLHHQNIVGFLGTALSGNIISILMEYIPGGSISNILNRFGPLPEKVFALYTRQILEGVVYLHDNRVIHRDLKGNNIMLMPSGVIKLIDFGCARRLNCLTHSGSRSDFLKSVHGTPYWMAPEVINETGHGKKSDIWSIGCTVFEMATGKPPLAHMGKMAALFYIGAQKGLMPSLPDDFSEEAKGFVRACLINDQKERPSAADLLRNPFIFHLRQPASSKPSNFHH